MRELELKDKRERRVKYFSLGDGIIKACLYDNDIHYLVDGKYREINNAIVEDEKCYYNKYNNFKVHFYKDHHILYQIDNYDENYYLKVDLLNKNNDYNIVISNNNINYNNIFNGVDLNYVITGSQLKETIILKNKNYDSLKFIIETDLNLELKNNSIIGIKNGKKVCDFVSPFMLSSDNNTSNDVKYELVKRENNIYELEIIFDIQWISKVKLPIYIDPIIDNISNSSVYDTYIYQGDTNVDRNSQSFLKIGPDQDKVYRTLMKYTLPNIGTSSQIISAKATLYSHPNDHSLYDLSYKHIAVHKITTDWDESTANWSSMSNNYASKVETYFQFMRSDEIIENGVLTYPSKANVFDITSLVKKWYSGEPNYGFLLKTIDETYDANCNVYQAISKNSNAITSGGESLQPSLTIYYRNQNGIIEYMDYENIDLLKGNTYINNYNGNVTNVINVNATTMSKLPVKLQLIYNTNDAYLGLYNYGWKFNYEQSIKALTIDSVDYLEYIDETSRTIYFSLNSSNEWEDEDGLGYIAKYQNNVYTIENKDGMIFYFTLVGTEYKLTKIKNAVGFENNFTYTSGKLSLLEDSDANQISISYYQNYITVISNTETVTIRLSNNKINEIEYSEDEILFSYNANNIITEIQGVNNIIYMFEYYGAVPYRLKKIKENINNTIINLAEYTYYYNSTHIKNSFNKENVYVFNDIGKLLGVCTKDSSGKLKNFLGYTQKYENDNTIELSSPNKFIKNLLTNGSFENTLSEDTEFFGGSRTNAFSHTGQYSYGSNDTINITLIGLEGGKTYTISGYLKNTDPVDFYVNNVAFAQYDLIDTLIVPESDNFSRFSITFTFPNDATSHIEISLEINNSGQMYLDDVQLEEGVIANEYNMLDNPDFADGISGWSISGHNIETGETITDNYQIVNINSEEKAIKIISNPFETSSLSKTFLANGSAGDVFKLSFSYKNEGVINEEEGYGEQGNLVNIQFFNNNSQLGECTFNINLNCHDDEWQYFTSSFVAENDYTSISINVMSQYEANSLYLTNFMLTKQSGSFIIEYDEQGNIISSRNNIQNISKFDYNNNNQLISLVTPSGNKIKYEYDNNIKNRFIKTISPMGIADEYKYDNADNLIKETVRNIGQQDLVDQYYYKIRLKGTNYFLDYNNETLQFLENDCSNKYYQIIVPNAGECLIKCNNKYLACVNNSIQLITVANDNCKFYINKNENGSYSLLLYSNDTMALSANSNNILFVETFDDNNVKQQFYFITPNQGLHIQANYEYDSYNKLQKVSDYLDNEYEYTYNNDGLLYSVINPNGIEQKYNYNTKKLISEISINNNKINYLYDSLNSITDIITPTDNYKFIYDEFMNKTQIKINNQTLVTNVYDLNRKKISQVNYANGSQKNYTYDDFGRLAEKSNDTRTTSFYYNNIGNIAKRISNNYTYEYFYDYSHRLDKLKYKNSTDIFYTFYNYNNDSQINKIKYSLNYKIFENAIFYDNNPSDEYEYIFNNDGNISNIIFNNGSMNYAYDELGRITSKSINNSIITNYSYKSKGNKTSLILNEYEINNKKYKLIYDNLNNITDVLINGIKTNHFEYDDIGELIKEDDYVEQKTIRYFYDLSGNMLYRKTYELETFNLISTDIYNYNSSGIKNQLTNYNNQAITYDAIGNMTGFGNKVFVWNNGSELISYTNGSNNTLFNYNDDGYIASKTRNNLTTKYYYDAGKLIYERTNTNIIHYLRDSFGDLIGLKYNGITYYYIKNYCDDIIGIMDNNYNIIANYKYNSWGKIISVTDENGNNITNSSHIAYINPYRYRSYYYDSDMDLYNLGKRYYDPEIGRFISMDKNIGSNQDILGYNLYLYVSNNPVNKSDNNGELLFTTIVKVVKKWPKIKETAKKVVNQLVKNPAKFINNVKKAFKTELGVGLGISAPVGPTQVGFYHDVNWNYDSSHSKIYDTTTSYAGISIEASKDVDIGLGVEVTHEPHIKRELWQKDVHDNPYLPNFFIDKCDHKTVSVALGGEYKIMQDDNATISKTEDFLGFQFTGHLGVGGHIKVGFDFSTWDFDD